MLQKILLLVFLLNSNYLFANTGDLKHFKTRYTFVYNDKEEVVSIIDNSMKIKKLFRKFVKNFPRMINSRSISEDVATIEDIKLRNNLENFFKVMRTKDLKGLIEEASFQRMVTTFEDRLNLKYLQYSSLANLNKKNGGFERKLIWDIANFAISQAVDLIGSGLPVRVFKYIISKFSEQFVKAHEYHRSILAYYLINYDAETLGLNEVARKKALSSLFENRVKFYQVKKRWRMSRDWENFGQKYQIKLEQKAAKKLNKYKKKFTNDEGFELLCFNKGLWKDKERIMNFCINRGLFSKKPSLSINLNNLKYIYNQRIAYEIVEMATALAPVVGIDFVFKAYLETRYRKQIEDEGLLYAYYEDREENEMTSILARQTVNFLEKFFLVQN